MDGYRPRPTTGLAEELGCDAASAVYTRLLVVGHSLHPAPNRQYAAIDIRRILPETVDVRVEQIVRDNSFRGDQIRWAVLGEGRKQIGIEGGSDIYIGIQTPRAARSGSRIAGKHGATETGEWGYKVALEANKPALLLPRYDRDAICAFVLEQMTGISTR